MGTDEIRDRFSKEFISTMSDEALKALYETLKGQLTGTPLPHTTSSSVQNQLADVITDIVSELGKR